MNSVKDFEKLWFLYKTEGEPKGMSINDFCIHQGVPYNEFNKWFRKTHRSVVPVQIEGCPVPEKDNETADVAGPRIASPSGCRMMEVIVRYS